MNIKDLDSDKYADMLYMDRPASTHPYMSMESRAGQFAPFAALNGFGGIIVETGRRTEQKVDISDEQIRKINETFSYVMQNETADIVVKITYFEPDELKNGGRYVTKSGIIRSINEVTGEIKFTDGTRIEIKNVTEAAVLSSHTEN